MATKKAKKMPQVSVKKVNPRGATKLTNLPKSKKKVGMYGLI